MISVLLLESCGLVLAFFSKQHTFFEQDVLPKCCATVDRFQQEGGHHQLVGGDKAMETQQSLTNHW